MGCRNGTGGNDRRNSLKISADDDIVPTAPDISSGDVADGISVNKQTRAEASTLEGRFCACYCY
jgi:hypothetical protein